MLADLKGLDRYKQCNAGSSHHYYYYWSSTDSLQSLPSPSPRPWPSKNGLNRYDNWVGIGFCFIKALLLEDELRRPWGVACGSFLVESSPGIQCKGSIRACWSSHPSKSRSSLCRYLERDWEEVWELRVAGEGFFSLSAVMTSLSWLAVIRKHCILLLCGYWRLAWSLICLCCLANNDHNDCRSGQDHTNRSRTRLTQATCFI